MSDQILMEHITEKTLEEAQEKIETDCPHFLSAGDPESQGRPLVNGRSKEEQIGPLLNPLISSCSFRKPSEEMITILRPQSSRAHTSMLSKEAQFQSELA